MEWPVYANGNPVFLNATRPARGRSRLKTEHPNHQKSYVQDGNGMLVPAVPVGIPVYRSSSTSARPSSVIIHNNHIDDHSPVRGSHRRRSSHGHNYYDDDSDWSDRGHSPRSRRRSHSHACRSHSRSSSPSSNPTPQYHDPEVERRLLKLDEFEKQEEEKAHRKAAEQRKKLEDIERKEEEAEARRRYEEEKLIEAEKKRRKEKEEKERRERYIEDWHREQEEKKKKEEEKRKAEDEAFRERTLKTFGAAGYSEESVTDILKKAERKKSGKKEKCPSGEKELQLMRPTYIKVHRKYLSTETLDTFGLPWEWDVSHALSTSSFTSPRGKC